MSIQEAVQHIVHRLRREEYPSPMGGAIRELLQFLLAIGKSDRLFLIFLFKIERDQPYFSERPTKPA